MMSKENERKLIDKLKFLEDIERKIEEDLDDFINKRGDKKKSQKKGVSISK